MPLLRVRAAAAESQPLSQNRGDRGPFSTDVLATLTLLLLVLLNPAASRDVRHTPGIPALTSSAGASLSFVFLMLPAASRPACTPRAPGLSLDPVSTLEFWSSVRCLVACAPGSRSQSAVSRVLSTSLPAPSCRWLPLPGARTWWLPPPSVYLLISVRGFTAPRFVPQYSALEMFICRDPGVSYCGSG